MHVQFAQALRYGSCTIVPGDFLIVTESHYHCAGRYKAFCKELLRRFEQAHQALFVVQCAAAVDAPVCHHTVKGWMLPVPLCAWLNGHYIHMCCEQNRL